MRNRFLHLLAALVLLAGTRAAFAQQNDAAVIAGLVRFIDALEAGDADALEESICAETVYHERTRKTFIDLATSQKALEKAAQRKFAEEGKGFRCGFDLIVNQFDRRTLASAKVRYEENTRMAYIERPGEVTRMTMRRTQGGQWQVTLDPVELETEDLDPPPLPYAQPGMMRQVQIANIRNARYNAIIAAFRETAARIDNGDLATATAAQAELSGKIAAASAAARAKAAIPSGRRERERQQQQQQQ